MTMTTMTTTYNKNSAAHEYWLGFVIAGLLYVMPGLTFEELATYFKMDHASTAKGGFAKIRIKMKSAQMKALRASALLLGSADLLMDAHWNKGEMFEKLITERFTGEQWIKDSVPFWIGPDAVINGKAVQIKLNGAELTNERTLAKYFPA